MGNAVDKIKAEYARKLRTTEIEDQVSDHLDPLLDGLPKPRIFVHDKPYGADVAWLTFGDTAPSYPPKRTTCTLEEALQIALVLRPLAAVIVKTSSTSFAPKISYKESDRVSSVEDVAPIWLKAEARGRESFTLKLDWFAEVPGVGIVRVYVELGRLSLYAKIASSAVDWATRDGERIVRAQRFSLGSEMHALHGTNGDVIAMAEAPIKWASGGLEYPSPYTIYFGPVGADMDPNVLGAEMLRALVKICGETS